jgi:hypothetical protein
MQIAINPLFNFLFWLTNLQRYFAGPSADRELCGSVSDSRVTPTKLASTCQCKNDTGRFPSCETREMAIPLGQINAWRDAQGVTEIVQAKPKKQPMNRKPDWARTREVRFKEPTETRELVAVS